MREISYFDYNSSDPTTPYTAYLKAYADECPICKRKQEPKFIIAHKSLGPYEVVFKCVNNDCRRFFISHYYTYFNESLSFSRSIPTEFQRITANKEIKEISEKFEEIFNQAVQAELIGLTEIAGMGYRKSLEFLIKDYLINFKGKDEDSISDKFLGKCIKEEIDNPEIAELAEKTTWLGNDETHYVRRNEDMDINDLKELLDLTVHWITYDIKRVRKLEKFRR